MEMPEKIYKYSFVNTLLPMIIGGIASSLGFICLGIWVIIKNTGGNWVPGGIFFISIGLIFLGAGIVNWILFRPIYLSSNGMIKIVLGRIWTNIIWSEVSRIEKIRYTEVLPMISVVGRRTLIFYDITTATSKLRIYQFIEQFPELTEELNAYAAQHNIELVFYDRRFETEPERRRIAAAMSDRKAARQVRKYGVAQKIERL